MKVFVLGGTGSIGKGLVRELISRSHHVIALSRSNESDHKLSAMGAQTLRGDLQEPELWIDQALECGAWIHVASTFADDMEIIDKHLVSVLTQCLNAKEQSLRLLYTGGCWLYGETGDQVATEETPFNPLKFYRWMIEFSQSLLNERSLSTAIIHPAMVYHEEGGVFEDFLASKQNNKPIEIWGNPRTRWPLIERSDLARAYCELLEMPELTGHFNVSAEEGVYVEDIVQTFDLHYGNFGYSQRRNIEELIHEYGGWAEGPTIDQQMSAEKLKAATQWQPLISDYRRSSLFSRTEDGD